MFGLNLDEAQKGYIALAIGTVLLLFSMGVFISLLKGIVFFVGVFLIIYGLTTTHVAQQAVKKIQSFRKKHN